LLPIIAGPTPSIRQLLAFRRGAEPSLSTHRLYSRASALARVWLRESTQIWWQIKHRLSREPPQSGRTPPQGGLAIAFVGPDGAGKSTLTTAIADWLKRELAVVTTYGGSGKGSASRPRRWLQAIAGLARRPPAVRDAAAETTPAEPSGLRVLGRMLWVVALARERRRWATQIRRGRSLGFVVLSDRLPQSQFAELNDGPRLGHWLGHTSWLRRTAAERERAAFLMAELVPPDLVVRLHVPVDVAARRKPDTPPDQLRRKIDIVAQLQFAAATKVVEINAAEPFAQVLLEVKQAIWESL
jgi:thymidylate kinase